MARAWPFLLTSFSKDTTWDIPTTLITFNKNILWFLQLLWEVMRGTKTNILKCWGWLSINYLKTCWCSVILSDVTRVHASVNRVYTHYVEWYVYASCWLSQRVSQCLVSMLNMSLCYCSRVIFSVKLHHDGSSTYPMFLIKTPSVMSI